MAKQRIFSGEPLPVPPNMKNPEVDAFNRKLIDYLRRLAAKIDRFTGTGGDGADGNVLVFAAYKDTEDTFDDTTPTPVPWDVVIRQDSIFTFTAPSAIIQVTEAGFYVVEVDLAPFKNLPFFVHVGIVDAGGSETDDIDYSYSGFPISNTNQSGSMMVPLELAANDRISVFAVSTSATGTNSWVVNGCRILISRISTEVTP